MPLSRLHEYLRSRIGLDPAAAGPGLVARAARTRMKVLGMTEFKPDAYQELLARSDDEFQAFVDEVVVPESWFLRDSTPFDYLRERARVALAADPARPPFRVLSMPCAGGEEPYSIAIHLLDGGIPAERFRVEGVDLSRRSIATARRAVYSENSFRSADLGFRDRHFRRTAHGYALDPSVAALVRFHQANLLDASFRSGDAPFDAVMCRNLLIYLDRPARDRVVANVDRFLATGGLLFLGHAEQLGESDSKFRPCGPAGAFAFERVRKADATPEVHPPTPRSAAVTVPHRRASPGSTSGKRTRKPVAPGTAPAPGPKAPGPPPRVHSGDENANESPLADASRLADEGRHPEAENLCREVILKRGPSPRAYFLLGIIRQAAGDHAAAEDCFAKAVYLDPAHDDALLALANLARRRGDRASEEKFRLRAERSFREKQRP